MLQGVNRSAQKCQTCLTPNFLQGAKMRTAAMPKMSRPQIFIWGHSRCAIMPLVHHPRKGASRVARKRQKRSRPHQFYLVPTVDCRKPFQARTKGRASIMPQKYQRVDALPNQLQGVNTITQKCQTNVAPTEFGPSALRRNAVSRSPNNQRPSHARRNAILQSPRN